MAAVVGCSDGGNDVKPATAPASAAANDRAAWRASAIALVLARSDALRAGDREAFLATVDPRETKFVATQARWFDNLAALPVGRVGLRLGDEDGMTRIPADGDYQLPVEMTLQLKGYDRLPVVQPLVYRFSAEGDDVLLTADRNLQSDAFSGWRPAPWDVTAIEVRTEGPVLGVFDASTVDSANHVMTEVSKAVTDLEGVVPPWSDRVVAYLIEDVDALDKMSLMDITNTAGVAFTLPTRPGSDRVAADRLALNPALINGEIGSTLTIRHEVGHVALGELDDSSPTWLVEGSAVYLANRALPITRVRSGFRDLATLGRLPLTTGRDFYQVNPTLNYNSASIVCTFVAETRGPEELWSLMRAFEREGFVSQADIDDIVRRELGRTTRQLGEDTQAWLLAG